MAGRSLAFPPVPVVRLAFPFATVSSSSRLDPSAPATIPTELHSHTRGLCEIAAVDHDGHREQCDHEQDRVHARHPDRQRGRRGNVVQHGLAPLDGLLARAGLRRSRAAATPVAAPRGPAAPGLGATPGRRRARAARSSRPRARRRRPHCRPTSTRAPRRVPSRKLTVAGRSADSPPAGARCRVGAERVGSARALRQPGCDRTISTWCPRSIRATWAGLPGCWVSWMRSRRTSRIGRGRCRRLSEVGGHPGRGGDAGDGHRRLGFALIVRGSRARQSPARSHLLRKAGYLWTFFSPWPSVALRMTSALSAPPGWLAGTGSVTVVSVLQIQGVVLEPSPVLPA